MEPNALGYLEERSVVPPLKWAGGKRWLVCREEFRPPKFDRLIEPFLGSGAVFFYLRPERAVLSDLNQDLINLYQSICTDHVKLSSLLRKHARLHSTDYYYRVRASRPRSNLGAAARLLYLNRTCWNGLYRVNKQGEFNVPIGTKDAVLLSSDNFARVSELLKNAELLSGDFAAPIRRAKKGDFIFADPPYTVAHKLNGFVKYNESIFSWHDQVRLRDELVAAAEKGAKFMLTNASHDSILDLYRGFRIRPVSRIGVIAGLRKARGSFEELLITNFDAKGEE